MPLCRLLPRFPLHSCLPTTRVRPQLTTPRWHQIPWSYSTASKENQSDERLPSQGLDLSNVSGDSDFLDFILGPSDLPGTERPAVTGDKELREETGSVAPARRASSGRKSSKTRRNRNEIRASSGAADVVRASRARQAHEHNWIGAQDQSIPSTTLQEGKLPQAALTSRIADLKTSDALAKQGIRERTKWVSVRAPGVRETFFSSFWNVEMARLQRRYNKKYKLYYLGRQRVPAVLPEAEGWAATALDSIAAGKTAVLAGLTDDATPRMTSLRRWQHAALWLLHHSPGRVADFLRYSHVAPYPPSQCVADLLQYLAMHFAHDTSASKSENLQALAEVLPTIADRQDYARLSLDSSFFAHILPHSTDYQVNKLFQAIKRHRIFVLGHTHLHFATYFSRNARFDQALDAILSAKHAKIDLNSVEFRSNCTTLLRNAIRHPDGLRMCLRIVDNLVSLGLTLNSQIANVVMLNAVEARDFNTAFNVYRSLTQHGLEPDAYTHAVLLKACKANIDDAEMLNQTIRSAIQHMDVLKNPVVATEVLHCLALHHSKHNQETAFETVINAYAQLFDMEPMLKLGLSSPNITRSDHVQGKMQPPPPALSIMIHQFLKHTYQVSQSTQPAYELYKRFCLLADAHVEPFASLLQYDSIANAFLDTFIKSRKGLLYATEVIKHMQKPSDPDAPVERCKPTVQTWSIFLHGFTRHRQMDMAEQILTYMRGKGIEPNEVTWNTLSAGYAAVQDVEGTLDVLRSMEADGLTWDRWTIGGLQRLRDQERFRQAYQRRSGTAAPVLDFTSDLKEDLQTRIGLLAEEEQELGTAEHRQRQTGDDEVATVVAASEGIADSPADLAENQYHPF